MMRKGYVTLMNRAPRLWAATLPRVRFQARRWIRASSPCSGAERDALAALLANVSKPAAVVSTYPMYGYMLNEIAKRGGPNRFSARDGRDGFHFY